MKSQNSEIYFIVRDTGFYWYGKYNYTGNTYYWSLPTRIIQNLTFEFNASIFNKTSFKQLTETCFIIHSQSTPFNLAYLQINYPELLI